MICGHRSDCPCQRADYSLSTDSCAHAIPVCSKVNIALIHIEMCRMKKHVVRSGCGDGPEPEQPSPQGAASDTFRTIRACTRLLSPFAHANVVLYYTFVPSEMLCSLCANRAFNKYTYSSSKGSRHISSSCRPTRSGQRPSAALSTAMTVKDVEQEPKAKPVTLVSFGELCCQASSVPATAVGTWHLPRCAISSRRLPPVLYSAV